MLDDDGAPRARWLDPWDEPQADDDPTGDLAPADPADLAFADQRETKVVGLARRIRESAADRVPVAVRAPGRGLSWSAVALALFLAVALAVGMFARARTGVAPSTVAARGGSGGYATRSQAARSPSTASGAVLPNASVGPPGAVSPTAGSPTAGAQLVVHVVGRVHRPGLIRLPPGSRVWDAVVAAGGADATARLERLNLARPLSDGEQVLVPGASDPVVQDADPAVGATSPPQAAPGLPVDLNTATAAQLDALPGVGPVLAARIVAWRTEHGRFSRVDELGEVAGIGPKLLAQLRARVRA